MAILVYSKTNCSACKRTKMLLNAFEVAFEERNVEDSDEYMAEAKATGFSAMPIIVMENEVLSGHQPAKLEELFG